MYAPKPKPPASSIPHADKVKHITGQKIESYEEKKDKIRTDRDSLSKNIIIISQLKPGITPQLERRLKRARDSATSILEIIEIYEDFKSQFGNEETISKILTSICIAATPFIEMFKMVAELLRKFVNKTAMAPICRVIISFTKQYTSFEGTCKRCTDYLKLVLGKVDIQLISESFQIRDFYTELDGFYSFIKEHNPVKDMLEIQNAIVGFNIM